ncbi:hypothetical protein X751_16580 [Mesorhizobium sp. LNJC395A00]|nr:hypothetical protein X751_16580 [Mesorhizobium sp. LNJC395A00]
MTYSLIRAIHNGNVVAENQERHDEAHAPELHTGFEGHGSFDCHQGRKTLAELPQLFDVHLEGVLIKAGMLSVKR